MSNPAAGHDKMPHAMMEEDEPDERRLVEQLQAFLSDACRVLFSDGEADAQETLALLPVLSEFLGACSGTALSLDQRGFITALIEIASVRLLLCATLPSDVSSLTSKRFLEYSLGSLEQACAEPSGKSRDEAHAMARRAIACILALCSDAEPEAAELSASLDAARAASRAAAIPRFDELVASPPLQGALARRLAESTAAAAKSGSAPAAATPAPPRADPFGDALAALSPFEVDGADVTVGAAGAASHSAASVWDPRVLARDLRRQNAEALLASPCNGAKRLAACCTQARPMPPNTAPSPAQGRWECQYIHYHVPSSLPQRSRRPDPPPTTTTTGSCWSLLSSDSTSSTPTGPLRPRSRSTSLRRAQPSTSPPLAFS